MSECSKSPCGLCNLDFGGSDFIITICDRCNVPLAIFREHAPDAPAEIIDSMILALRDLGDGEIDAKMRSIPEHFHIHLRKYRRFQCRNCLWEIDEVVPRCKKCGGPMVEKGKENEFIMTTDKVMVR